MKKILALGMVVVMTLAMGLTAFASSPEAPANAVENQPEITGTADDGSAVTITPGISVPAPTPEDLGNIGIPGNAAITALIDVNGTGPVWITFNFSGTWILHFVGGEWVQVGSGNRAFFDSFSPVAFVNAPGVPAGEAAADGGAAGGAGGSGSGTSPKTADAGMLAFGIVAIIALGGVALVSKKRSNA